MRAVCHPARVQVPGYRIIEPIGRGGMSSVFLASGPRGEVVLKVLRSTDREALERFAREARLLAALGEADGVVPLLDSGPIDEGAFIAMPFLRGGTLADRLGGGPLPLERGLDLARALAATLARIHALGIVHRDLKPANVLFREPRAWEPLVADLGLGKFLDAGESRNGSLSGTGMLAGTIGYMAPEQIDDARAATPRSDVFSLAAVVFECLSGSRPYASGDLLGYVTDLRRGRAARLGALVKAPGWLDAALARALAADPADRFADGAALLAALGPPGRPRSPRDRAALAVIALSLVAALGLGVFALTRPRPPAVSPPEAAPPRPAPSPPLVTPPVAPAPVEPAETAATLSARGRALIDKGDFDGALVSLDRAIALDGRDAATWNSRGFARMRKGDRVGARADFTRSLELDPKSAITWVNCSLANHRLGDDVAALADATRATELAPMHLPAWTAKANALRGLERLGEAFDAIEKALAIDPQSMEGLVGRAVIRARTGDLAGARGDLKVALARNPRNDEALSQLCLVELASKDVAAATAAANAMIELRPNASVSWSLRARARAQGGDTAGAIADAGEALSRSATARERADLLTLRGRMRQQREDAGEALADFDAALDADPAMATTRMMRAVLRSQRGDRAGALADCERILEQRPGEPLEGQAQRLAAKLR